MELAIQPHSIVSWFVLVVVEDASTIYVVVFEFSLVESPVVEEEKTGAMFFAVEELAFVAMTLLVCYLTDYELVLLLNDWFGLFLAELIGNFSVIFLLLIFDLFLSFVFSDTFLNFFVFG